MSDDKRVFFLAHDQARRGVMEFAFQAPVGWKVTFEPAKRSGEQNDRLHAMLGEIADRCDWAGRKWDIETWKRLFVAAWDRATKQPVVLLPALDDHGVDVVFRRTSKLSRRECAELMDYIEAWAAERPEFQVLDGEPFKKLAAPEAHRTEETA